jgi:hypothetical protein
MAMSGESFLRVSPGLKSLGLRFPPAEEFRPARALAESPGLDAR